MFAKPVVKIKESLCRINTQACGHIFKIGKSGTEANQTHFLLCQLHITDCPGYQRLEHWSTVVMQKVNFILC